METVLDLNPTTLEALQGLVRTNLGSADFYAEAAAQIKSPVLASEFALLAKARNEHARLLASHLELHGVDVPESGTLTDSMHETWARLRGLINGGDNCVLLIEAERAEDRIKATYERLIEHTLGSAVSPLLHAQLAQVKATHDQIRALRDAFQA